MYQLLAELKVKRPATPDRMSSRSAEALPLCTSRTEAVGTAAADLVNDSIDDRLVALEEQEEVERLLTEIKARRRAE